MKYTNPYGQNFVQESKKLATVLLEYFQLPGSEYTFHALELIETELEKRDDYFSFMGDYFMHAVALVGEAVLGEEGGRWAMELDEDGVSWAPVLLIGRGKYDVGAELYNDVFNEQWKGPVLSTTHIVFGASIHMDQSMPQIAQRECAYDYRIHLVWGYCKSEYETYVQKLAATLQFLTTVHPSFALLPGAGDTPLIHRTGNGSADWAYLYTNDDDAQSHSFHVWGSKNPKLASSLSITISNAPGFEAVNNEACARAIYTGLIEQWQALRATLEYKDEELDNWNIYKR